LNGQCCLPSRQTIHLCIAARSCSKYRYPLRGRPRGGASGSDKTSWISSRNSFFNGLYGGIDLKTLTPNLCLFSRKTQINCTYCWHGCIYEGPSRKPPELRLGTPITDPGPSHFRITPSQQALFYECVGIFSNLVHTIQTTQVARFSLKTNGELTRLSRINAVSLAQDSYSPKRRLDHHDTS